MDKDKEIECWHYEGKCLETAPEGWYGFIYSIRDDKGWYYFGKKAFVHAQKKVLSKKARAASDNPRVRVSRGTKDSGWLDYWGSCKPLLAYIAERGSTQGFHREIIKLCRDKQSLAYWETDLLIRNGVLWNDKCWNGNVAAKYFKGKIHL